MLKTLFVLPGGGDPKIKLYKKVYDIIKQYSIKYNYGKVKVFSYPGHFSYIKSKKDLEINSSVRSIILYFNEKEKKKQSYDVICRSYGCSVFMEILLKYELKYVNKITFWGPSPYLNHFKVIMNDKIEGTRIGLEKRVRLSAKTFNSISPFEIQLMKYRGQKTIHIGTGKKDKHCKPVFLRFLNQYLDKDKRFVYKVIKGVGHEVDYPNKDYLDFIF